jgi:hypothetical protein
MLQSTYLISIVLGVSVFLSGMQDAGLGEEVHKPSCTCLQWMDDLGSRAYNIEKEVGDRRKPVATLLDAAQLRSNVAEREVHCITNREITGLLADWLLEASADYLIAAEDAHFAGDEKLAVALLKNALALSEKVSRMTKNASRYAQQITTSVRGELRGKWPSAEEEEIVRRERPTLPTSKKCVL